MERQPSSSSSARVPSEGGTKSSRSSLTFISPSLFCFIIPSSLLLIFFSVKVYLALCHTNTDAFFLFCFCLVFCLLTFIFCKPTCFPLLSPSVFFSTSLCPTRLHPSPVSVTRTVSCSFTLSFFVILVCLTTGTEMVLEARQTLGDIVLWCMLRQQYFPSAPECLSPPPFCPRLLLCSQ